jgi:imidazole glycerol phosphate synthase glutamine amidotransferase subunit
MTVALVDYGAGNLSSVERALRRLGADTVRAAAPEMIAGAEAIVLPGVGHFASLVLTLKRRNLFSPLRDSIASGVPFLGICLGLQALYESSEEAPGEPGLGLLRGTVTALPAGVKLPHMGWNRLQHLQPSRLLRGISSEAYFYFAHSFAVVRPEGATAAVCNYGTEFVAVIEQKNLFAVQFHPEKSGSAGARVLRNFLEASR